MKSTVSGQPGRGDGRARGVAVGLLDADIHGHSIPRMMGTTDRPTQVESMILPPIAHEVKVISIAQFDEGNTPRSVAWADAAPGFATVSG